MLVKKKHLFCFATIGLIFFAFAAYKNHERNVATAFLPITLQVEKVLDFGDSYGIGPGWNDSVAAIYQMQDDMAGGLSIDGLTYLRKITPQLEWNETPTPNSSADLCGSACGDLSEKSLFLIDQIARHPGSYYTKYSKDKYKNGIIFVSPNEKTVIYLYKE